LGSIRDAVGAANVESRTVDDWPFVMTSGQVVDGIEAFDRLVAIANGE
jgi:hypothetical protein